MTDKAILQDLFDSSQQSAENIRNLQNAIKKFNTLKKDSEQNQQKEVIIKTLHSFIKDLEKLQSKAISTKNNLEKQESNVKDSAPNDETDQGGKKDSAGDRQKRLPHPEDQENMYHLRARMMPQYQASNHALQAEVLLKNRRNLLRAQRYQTQLNFNKESNLSAATTLHAIHMYEKKAKAAEEKVDQLQEELDALKGTTSAGESQQASGKSASTTGQSFLGPNNRVNDVIRKNEVFAVENKTQQHEIQRLKKENSDLILKAKHAQQDRNQIMSQLSTSEMARKDLHCRFQKQKDQHDRLNRSVTRQSVNWIESRKYNDQVEEDIRWSNVGHAAPYGGYGRTHQHPVTRNVDQPRYMYPVERYAQSAQA